MPEKRTQSDDECSNQGTEIIDVDFEFFNPESIDFHGSKNLLKQLFSGDCEKLNLSAMVEKIIDQSFIGCTVKVDGDSDPYALMSVLNITGTEDYATQLKDYLINRCLQQKEQQNITALKDLLSSKSKQIGFLINERLVNMPVEIVVPMLRMLQSELSEASKTDSKFKFDYFLLICKVYQEVDPVLEEDNHKKKKLNKNDISFYFQPEDEIFEKNSMLSLDFTLEKETSVAEAKNSFTDFGIDPKRRILLIESSKLAAIYEEMASLFSHERPMSN